MKQELPQAFRTFCKKYPQVAEAFEVLGRRCHEAGPLDDRTRRLVKLGIAMGAGLEGAVHSAVRNALAAGISPEEIAHCGLLAITTVGWPAALAAITWIDDVSPRRSRKARR